MEESGAHRGKNIGRWTRTGKAPDVGAESVCWHVADYSGASL